MFLNQLMEILKRKCTSITSKRLLKALTKKPKNKVTILGLFATNQIAYSRSKKEILDTTVLSVTTSLSVKSVTKRTQLTLIDSLKQKLLQDKAHLQTLTSFWTRLTWDAMCVYSHWLISVNEYTLASTRNAVRTRPEVKLFTGAKSVKKNLSTITNGKEFTEQQDSRSMLVRSTKTKWHLSNDNSTWTSCLKSITILTLRMLSRTESWQDSSTHLLVRKIMDWQMKRFCWSMIKS